MESMTYRGVESTLILRLKWAGGGGGGLCNNAKNVIHSSWKQGKSSPRQIANIGNYQEGQRHKSGEREICHSKSGDYSHKSGDREILFKIWSVPDYPGELTVSGQFYTAASQYCNSSYPLEAIHLFSFFSYRTCFFSQNFAK